MAKNQDQQIAAEDAEAASARARSEDHQAAIAAEETERRVDIAKAATGTPEELVEVTVTKFGEGRVSTGEHIPAEGDVKAKRGEKMMVSPSVAADLEARGFAER